MAKKWIRKDNLGRILEIKDVSDEELFEKSWSPEFIAAGEMTELDCSDGQVYDEVTDSYIDYVEPEDSDEKKNARKKRTAKAKRDNLRLNAIDLMISKSNDPAVKDIHDEMEVEKAKM